jgi:hypothetical protein
VKFKLTAIVLLITTSAVCQSFLLEPGWIARATVGHYRQAKMINGGALINADAPYIFSKGVDGMGLNLTVGYVVSQKIGFALRAGTTIRYDFFKQTYDNGCTSGCDEYTFYVDQTFAVTKSIFKDAYVGGSFTMYNLGKELTYNAIDQSKTLQLHFNSIDAFGGFRVWDRIFVEPKFSYVPDSFPGRVKRTATLLGVRLYYRVTVGEKKN